MKKILYLSDVSIDNVGGAQESMKEIIKGLSRELDFYIITPVSNRQFKNQIILDNYNDFILKNKSFNKIIKLCFDIKKEIDKVNPDIIHVQMPSTMIIIGVLRYFNFLDKSVKIFYTDRGVLNKYGNLTKLSIKMFSKKFTKIIATTEYNADLHKKINNLPMNKIEVIYNTAGELFDNYDINTRINMRGVYNIKEDDIVVGFSGRLSSDKNWPLAIELLKELTKYHKIKVVIALGTNKLENHINEAKNTIKTIDSIVGNENVISFIDISLEEMAKIYYLNDIFILTSKKESFGRTAVEAMSRKNIVFGTRVDGLEEVIHFEENKYSSIKEIVEKINRTLAVKNLLSIEKEKFYNYYNLNYKTDICLSKHLKLYKTS